MDYYEELALSRSATADQVRSAYHLATRLLHPDSQQNPELRRVAECQMRRLNEIFGTLSDPIARADYDLRLAGRGGHRRRPRARPDFKSLVLSRAATAVWSSAVAVLAFSILLLFRDEFQPRPVEASRKEVTRLMPETGVQTRVPESLEAEIKTLRRDIERLNHRLQQMYGQGSPR